MLQLLVLLVTGRVGKALLTEAADHRPLFSVHVHVALQVREQAEGLATLRAAVARHLGVHLQSDGIRKRLETQGTVVEAFGVCLFMVEEGAGVAVGAATQVTPAVRTGSYSITRPYTSISDYFVLEMLN